MKNKILILLTLLVSSYAHAQWGTAGTNIYSTNTGNVGIGVINAPDKLTVMGNVGTYSIYPWSANTYDVGSTTKYFNNVFTKNISLGGVSNFIKGVGNNVLIGNGAGHSSLYAGDHVLIGTGAGANTGPTASTQIMLGYQAGYNSSGGANAVLIGYQAGYTTTFAGYPIYIGYRAGYYTTGGGNTFIGSESGYNTTTGTNNAFIGDSGGRNNTTGQNNVVFGAGAASYNTTGSYNTFVGNNSGDGNVGGTNNVAIGYQAYPYFNLSDGVFVGYNARPATSGLSSVTAIGSGASVGVSNGFVLGTSSTLVGIRNSYPAYALHVLNAYCDGNTWFNSSDKNLKENFTSLRDERILDKIMELKIEKWNYIGDVGVRHIGPTAQNFSEVFRLGGSNKSIASVDEAGIALAGIQELNIKTQKMEESLVSQQKLLAALLTNKAENVNESVLGSRLHQNNPNPFSFDTKINFEISEGVKTATVSIYDLNGKLMKESTILERGRGSITIEGGTLKSGIYFYTLIADGAVVGIRRMIMTE